jgi:hypothetical protein
MTLDHETRALLRVAVSNTRRERAAARESEARERDRIRKSAAASAAGGSARALLGQPKAVQEERPAVPARVVHPPIPEGSLQHLAVERGRNLLP